MDWRWNDPIRSLLEWLEAFLIDSATSLGLDAAVGNLIYQVIGVFTAASIVLGIFIFLTWLERKVAARLQDRIGPNRVGPYGLLQPIADAIKMITKEDTTPNGADKFVYNFAPMLAVVSVLMMWAVIPIAGVWFDTDLNVAVLYIAAVGSFGVLAVLMAGWSSNNKYALLGAFRAVAQLVSYEVPLFLSLLIPVFLARSMSLRDIVGAQPEIQDWFVLFSPLAFFIFFISNLAEIGRTPFDLLEAESEIVAGYHVEYSGMKFGMFQAGEFMHAFTSSALIGILFFGGWNGPGVADFPVLGLVYFFGKAFFFYFIIMWIRSTFPRIRIDHMMDLSWKFLVPVSLILLMLTPLVEFYVKESGTNPLLAHLGLNVVLFIGIFDVTRRYGKRRQVERVQFPKRPVAVPPKKEEAA